MDTSREAYEAAAGRYETINEMIHQRRMDLLAQLDALSGEWDDALDNLRQHEAYPGIPAWEHIENFTAGTCPLGTRCRVHSAAAMPAHPSRT